MDTFHQILEALFEKLHSHWVQMMTGAALMVLGWYFGKRRAKADWKKRDFFDRLNVSLNSFHDGKLLIRTILEKSCQEIMLNTVAVEAIIQAAKKTTEKDPVLPLPEVDYWYYLNAVLNEVAEKFSQGQMQRDLGYPVRSDRYLLCLTSEVAGDLRTHKVRAMLVQKSALTNLPKVPPQLESPHHKTRWGTLQPLAAEYAKSPYKFLELEICL